MKLTDPNNETNIAQFEYTLVGDKPWYDMSFVNYEWTTFPDWELTCSEEGSVPHKNFYRSASDDPNGMQTPPALSATVTLHLCPGSGGAAAAPTASATATTSSDSSYSTGSASPASTVPSSAAAYTSSSSVAAPSTTLHTKATSYRNKNVVTSSIAVSSSPVATVLANEDNGVEIVTEYATQVITAVVTETAGARRKRHEHRHPHGPHHA